MSYPGYPSSTPTYPPYPSALQTAPSIGFAPSGMQYPSTATQGYPSYPASCGPSYMPSSSVYPALNPVASPYSTPYPSTTSYPGSVSQYPQPSSMPTYPSSAPAAPSGPSMQQPYGYQTPGSMYPGSVSSMGYPTPANPHTSYAHSPVAPSYPATMGMAMTDMGSVPSYAGAMYSTQQTVPQHLSYAANAYPTNQGTIKPYPNFDAKYDAEVLRKAMKGMGTDEKAIIKILANRTYAQRSQIELMYKTMYGKDLVNNLKSELSGNFENVIVALMMPRERFLAKCLRNAIVGLGTAERTIVEVLCTSTNSEIHSIKAAYQHEYRSTLERDIKGDTSGYFKRLLVSLSVGNRSESPHIDRIRAAADAQALYQAGEARWGTDESVFNAILVSQSFPQLRYVFDEYERMSRRTIEQALHNEMSGDLLNGMIAVVKCVRNKNGYFSERLHNAMSDLGTIDSCLIRIIISRSEIDLRLIKEEYFRMYGKTLEADISNDTSGDYKRVLLEILHE